jgi:60 kDa SS-A/Ro ribonucleoprotein
MSTIYREHTDMRKTAQTVRSFDRNDEVMNNAGGYVFQLTPWARLQSFLILGSEGGTYYVSAKKLTKDNANNLIACIKEDGERVVREIVAVSDAGRAPNNDPALFALAAASALGNLETRRAAFRALPKVARIPTHLFHFVEFREGFGGWGRGMKKAVQEWYQKAPVGKLAYHAVKYKGRDGWTNRDLLRLAKPKPEAPERDAVYGFMVTGEAKSPAPKIIEGHEAIKIAKSADQAAKLITEYRLPREAIPTQFLNSEAVWKAMIPDMPITAMVRNLGKMTSINLLKDSEVVAFIVDKLTNSEVVTKSRIHPMQVLVALRTYVQGRGFKGSLSWKPVDAIRKALNELYYMSFQNADPANKRWILGVDVSGSMSAPVMGGVISCSEAAAAMAMVWARTEPEVLTFGFDQGFKSLPLNKTTSLEKAMEATRAINFGGTDCSLPITWATQKNVKNDVFVVLTDNETYAGSIKPYQALQSYRQKFGIDAKLVVVGMTTSWFSIADPSDSGMLDVVGMDSAVPGVVTDFARGWSSQSVPRLMVS